MSEEFVPAIKACANAAEEVYQQYSVDAANFNADATRIGEKIVWMILGIFAVLLVIAVVVMFYLVRGITKPIAELESAYGKMSQGIDQDIEYESKGDLVFSPSFRVTSQGLHGSGCLILPTRWMKWQTETLISRQEQRIRMLVISYRFWNPSEE